MKKIIIFLGLISILNANIEIQQNMRALYKGVPLTETQENYIFDNEEIIIRILKNDIKKEIKHFKQINEKNIIKFVIDTNGKITNIKFLKNSNNRKLDRNVKKAIKKATKKLPRPKEKTELRYIISYNKGQKAEYSNYSEKATSSSREIYYQTISRGTTRFQHSSKEYVRVFETSRDGFINASTKPSNCATIKVLTSENQNVRVGYISYQFNAEIPQGKYKLLIKTKKLCDISLEYL